GARTGVGEIEPPEAGEVQVFGKTQHEVDDTLDIALISIMDPELRAARPVLLDEIEAVERGIVGIRLFGAQAVEQRHRLGGILRRSRIKQAGKVGEVVGHDRLLVKKWKARREAGSGRNWAGGKGQLPGDVGEPCGTSAEIGRAHV